MPKKWTLEIEFGGLCMFVPWKSGDQHEGLHVLMPRVQGNEQAHHPVLEYGQGNGNVIRVPLDKTVVALRTQLSQQAGTHKLPAGLARVSWYAGKPVDPVWISGATTGCLSARVELPLGSEIEAIGKKAKMKSDKAGAQREELRGRAVVRCRDNAADSTFLDFAGITFFRHPEQKVLRFRILNVNDGELNKPCQHAHKKGEYSTHFQAYYRLLKDNCQNPESGPLLRFDDDEPGDGDCTRISGYGTQAVEFIDPYNCTIGGGCPTAEGC